MANPRLKRLHELESTIRNGWERFVHTGLALREIQTDELWKEDGYSSWEVYCNKRIVLELGVEARQVQRLMLVAEVRKKVPDLPTVPSEDSTNSWKVEHLEQLARLAPPKKEHNLRYDPASLRKADVNRVVKAAVKEAGDKPLTTAIIKKAVDADLGIDRKRERQRRQKEKEAEAPNLPQYIRRKTDAIEGMLEVLQDVPAAGWKELERTDPGLAEKMAMACDALAEFLRS